MTNITLQASVKNLVAGTGLNLATSANNVNLTINNGQLAQILSTILQSNSSVTVNYSSSSGTITFTSAANVTQSQIANLMAQILQTTGTIDVDYDSTNDQISLSVLSAPPPDSLVITNKNQFDSNNEINVLFNQNVILMATDDNDWDDNTDYTIIFPTATGGIYNVFVAFNLSLDVNFPTSGTSAIYDLSTMAGHYLGVSYDGAVSFYQGLNTLYSP